ncbi:hypothetical protein CEUSTIGMA_g1088.t1 [Chlamydomonas eustigma]|uniref:mitogen-activated protein kinase kinase kinase n=1 Tax=Chlamydomonas eustigma TaxID=1157962 RepID=A0A250WS04_9CHLO|nr:hypothetical protein CEUSTIGMA_g1088.t1 [Chlamydomonas eustigma]|eukprot:GAX73637.1 hypothetical protein CEUSTIGMA_g1088.t1 [Chlamydomonas eustigma]
MPMGGCISLITADTSPVRPPEPVLRFRDPYNPGNQQYQTEIPGPSVPTYNKYAQYHLNAAHYRQAESRLPVSSTASTGASATGNAIDLARSDANFTGKGFLNGESSIAPAATAVVAIVNPVVEASTPQPAKPVVEEQDVVAFPSSWTRGKLIGAGAFGQVYMGLNNDTGEFFAVKQVGLTKDEGLKGKQKGHVLALEAEVAVLKLLRNEHIVQYIGTERTEDHLNIFLEYIAGGSIASLIDKFGPLQENVVRVYTKQILKGLEYLHQRKIMHRDIKGANILVDKKGTIKLADFGASKKIEDLATMGSAGSGAKSIRGTPYWMAPEVIKQTGHGRPADIWSLGCVVIEMATGRPPWSDYSPVAAMWHIASTGDMPTLPTLEIMSSQARDFLLQCFNRIPKDRPNATRLLKHPWLADVSLPAARSAAAAIAASLAPTHHNNANTAAGISSTFSTPNSAMISQRVDMSGMPPPSGMRSPPSPIKEEDGSPPAPEPVMLPLLQRLGQPVSNTQQFPPAGTSQQASMAPAAAVQQNRTKAPVLVTASSDLKMLESRMYDTITSPPPVPMELRTKLQQAALIAPQAVKPAVREDVSIMLNPEAEVDRQLLQMALYGTDSLPPGASAEMAQMSAFLALQQQHNASLPHHVQEPVPDVRSSMLTLNFNPMEEPSWVPNGPMAAMLAPMIPSSGLRKVDEEGEEEDLKLDDAEHAAMLPSPPSHELLLMRRNAAEEREMSMAPPSEMSMAPPSEMSMAPPSGHPSSDTVREQDQPSPRPQAEGNEGELTEIALKQPQRGTKPFIPKLHGLSKLSTGTGGPAAVHQQQVPVMPLRMASATGGSVENSVEARGGYHLPPSAAGAVVGDVLMDSKMAKWRDELLAELESKRKEQQQQATALRSVGS